MQDPIFRANETWSQGNFKWFPPLILKLNPSGPLWCTIHLFKWLFPFNNVYTSCLHLSPYSTQCFGVISSCWFGLPFTPGKLGCRLLGWDPRPTFFFFFLKAVMWRNGVRVTAPIAQTNTYCVRVPSCNFKQLQIVFQIFKSACSSVCVPLSLPPSPDFILGYRVTQISKISYQLQYVSAAE